MSAASLTLHLQQSMNKTHQTTAGLLSGSNLTFPVPVQRHWSQEGKIPRSYSGQVCEVTVIYFWQLKPKL